MATNPPKMNPDDVLKDLKAPEVTLIDDYAEKIDDSLEKIVLDGEEIILDHEGCEKRSDDSDTEGSLVEFIAPDETETEKSTKDEEPDSEEEILKQKILSPTRKRVRKPVKRFEVVENWHSEWNSDDSDSNSVADVESTDPDNDDDDSEFVLSCDEESDDSDYNSE